MEDLKSVTIKTLKKHNLFAKHNLGQNFLISQKILNKLINAANISNDDKIIEIGPGIGTLSKEIIKKCKNLTCIEKDKNLMPILNQELATYKNISIKNEDALNFDLPQKKSGKDVRNNNYKLVANIPYYITSPIIRHFLRDAYINDKITPSIIVLLVQKEVAEKICASKGKLNVLALNVQILGKPQIICSVKPSSFYPAPKVESAILKITTFKKPIIKSNINKFLKITNSAFKHKRKTLANSLKPLSKNIDDIFIKTNIDKSKRPQHLSITEWDKLVEAFQ